MKFCKQFANKRQGKISHEPKNIQQEILVITQTSFAQKTVVEKKASSKKTLPAEIPVHAISIYNPSVFWLF
ncbi:MAG: hypothetical protein ABIN01_15655 [Ferruginibacter sp.]